MDSKEGKDTDKDRIKKLEQKIKEKDKKIK